MRFHTYHLPEGRNVRLIEPPLEDLPRLLHDNRRRLAAASFGVAGVPLAQVAAKARERCLAEAAAYSRALGRQIAAQPAAIVATGHQPGIHHPGVWIKNHLVDHLARATGSCGLNIILDSDVPGDLLFRVPRITDGDATVDASQTVAAKAGVAVEEQRASPAEYLEELPRRVLPLLPWESSRRATARYLGRLLEGARAGRPLRDVFAGARVALEQDWGLRNLELPYSAACGFDSFQLLVLEIIRRAEEFAAIYNEQLAAYRTAFKVRGKANPLPALAAEPGSVELPLWAWRAGGERRPASVARRGGGVVLQMGDEPAGELSASELADAAAGMAALRRLAASGLRIRSKAIVTTIHLRLFLSDLFIHGIGGGNYDIITDGIIREFFRFEPPAYAVTTANASLPLDRPEVDTAALRNAEDDARRIRHAPHKVVRKLVPDDAEVEALLCERRGLLERQSRTAERREKKRLFESLKRVDAVLRGRVEPFYEEKAGEVARLRRAVHRELMLSGRSYPFCIYPEEILRELYDFG